LRICVLLLMTSVAGLGARIAAVTLRPSPRRVTAENTNAGGKPPIRPYPLSILASLGAK
jgi:hypothetical protein